MNNITRETGEPAAEFETRVTDQEKSEIEEVLLDRVDGPFEPWPENWAEEMKARVHARIDAYNRNER